MGGVRGSSRSKNDGLKDVSRMEDVFGVERIQNLKDFLALKLEGPIS